MAMTKVVWLKLAHVFFVGRIPLNKTPVSFNQMGSPDVGNTFEAFEGGLEQYDDSYWPGMHMFFFGGNPW